MAIITNRDTLAVSAARTIALDLAEAGLAAIDTAAAITNNVAWSDETLTVQNQIMPVDPVGKLLVIAIGKCAMAAAAALESILGDRIDDGISLDIREDPTCQLKRIRCLIGDHPFPTERNINASREIINLLSGLTKADTVIVAVSGGGSTLLCQPGNFTCQAEEALIQQLFTAGATIEEINIIRKHLSTIRGGHLAKLAYPATVIGLIFSDVPGDRPDLVASGPTYKDNSTVDQAKDLCQYYKLCQRTGFSPEHFLPTPKEDKYFKRVTNLVLVSNTQALKAICQAANSAGWAASVKTNNLIGEASQVGQKIAADINQADRRQIFIYGGETTVTITGQGQGGRNQELALGALPILADDSLVLALASDGRDNTDYAGALVDKITAAKARRLNLIIDQYLTDNNSAEFFRQVEDYLMTGPTGVNVADLIIAVKT